MTVPRWSCRILVLAVALLALAGAGCQSMLARLPRIPVLQPGAGATTEAELRDRLGDLAGLFLGTVASTADAISDGTEDRAIKKRSLLWKVRLAPMMQDAVSHSDARVGFVRALSVAVLQRQYLTEGDGRAVFGAAQGWAVDAARALEARALETGATFLKPAELERVRAQVEEAVARRPIRGTEFDVRTAQTTFSDPEVASSLGWIVSLPLSPFSALEGVSSGAAAIHEFNQTAQGFSEVVAGLPEVMRWEIELMLWDLEGRDSVAGTLAALERASESAERVSLAAQALPEDLRTLLVDAQAPLAQARETIERSQELAQQVATTAEQLRIASASWERILARDGGERDPDARPFDVREYEATAREIGTAAERLEALTRELHALAASDALAPALAQTVQTADATTRAWIDAAFWRGIQLLLVFFALLVGYRVLARRIDARRA